MDHDEAVVASKSVTTLTINEINGLLDLNHKKAHLSPTQELYEGPGEQRKQDCAHNWREMLKLAENFNRPVGGVKMQQTGCKAGWWPKWTMRQAWCRKGRSWATCPAMTAASSPWPSDRAPKGPCESSLRISDFLSKSIEQSIWSNLLAIGQLAYLTYCYIDINRAE